MIVAITGNKGEWAELYAFLKILADGKLPAADENYKIEEGKFFEFLELHGIDENSKNILYEIGKDSITISGVGVSNKVVLRQDIAEKTDNIFNEIMRNDRTFSIISAEELMQILSRHSIKAPSQEKTDVFATLVDRSTNTPAKMGFSVKSNLKSPATLLNAAGTTKFRYEVLGVSEKDAEEINSISGNRKLLRRMQEIYRREGSVKFCGMVSSTFERNLRKIDSLLPEIVAEMLVGHYLGLGTTNEEYVDFLNNSDSFQPLEGFHFDKNAYEYKLKELLWASALGMRPGDDWDGLMKAHGGYLAVMLTGDVLCYHAFNRDVFLKYLFLNTKFDSPSSRLDFFHIFEDNGRRFIDICLQIRFKKQTV